MARKHKLFIICKRCRGVGLFLRADAKYCSNSCRAMEGRDRMRERAAAAILQPTSRKPLIRRAKMKGKGTGNTSIPNVGPGNGGNLPSHNVADAPGSKGSSGGPNHKNGGGFKSGSAIGTKKFK